jgi:hypothetical protein
VALVHDQPVENPLEQLIWLHSNQRFSGDYLNSALFDAATLTERGIAPVHQNHFGIVTYLEEMDDAGGTHLEHPLLPIEIRRQAEPTNFLGIQEAAEHYRATVRRIVADLNPEHTVAPPRKRDSLRHLSRSVSRRLSHSLIRFRRRPSVTAPQGEVLAPPPASPAPPAAPATAESESDRPASPAYSWDS